MLSDDDKRNVVAMFCLQAFVRPNVCATINTEDILAEIDALEAGKQRTAPFEMNAEWAAIVDALIAEARLTDEEREARRLAEEAAQQARDKAAAIEVAKAALTAPVTPADHALAGLLGVLVDRINLISAKIGLDPIDLATLQAEVGTKIDSSAGVAVSP